MYLYLEDIGYFQMQAPSAVNDGNQETKDVQAYSAEKEFENKDWAGIEINTGTQYSHEMLVDGNVDELGFAKEYITVFNDKNTELSFLHMIQKELPWWSIGYVDAKIRDQKIPFLEIDNMNLYAVMTSEVAPRISCLFIFDYNNYEISVIHKDSLELDTRVFIGFRNLAQNVNISVNEDSIFTRFNVAGDDGLNINYHSYGSGQIINLDFFLGEPYMEEELAQKIRDWQQLQLDKKPYYLEKAKEVAAFQEDLDKLYYTVPADEAYWKNWSSMRKDGLEQNLKYFNGMLERFQILVDPRPEEEKYIMKDGQFVLDDNGNKIFDSKKNDDGEVDHEWYKQLLYENMDKYSGYYTYVDITEYILPYIQLALDNYGKPDWQQESPEDRGIEDPTERWDLYGYYELDGVRQSYEEDLITTLDKYSKEWSDMTEEERKQKGLDYLNEEGYNKTAGRVKYLHYVECLYGGGTIEKDVEGHDKTDPDKNNRKIVDNPGEDSIYHRLYELDGQIETVENQIAGINAIIGDYNVMMRYDVTDSELDDCTHADSAVVEERRALLFTTDEINLIGTLLHDTDYTNSNIFTTSIDTVYTTIDKEGELFEDASDKLVEVSQPQFTFAVSSDNFFRLTRYEDWYKDLASTDSQDSAERISALPKVLLRFIRVGIRDDYSIKLRVIGYRYNPCEVTPDLELEFSNMISSRSGRSDLIQLLEMENNAGSKNSISIGLGNSKSDQDYISNLIDLLSKNTIFKRSVSGIAGSTTGAIDVAAVQDIVTEMIGGIRFEGDTAFVENVIGNYSKWDTVIANNISSELISTALINGDQGIFRELSTDIIRIGRENVTLIADGLIETAKINVDQITGEQADFDELFSTYITAETIATKFADINSLQADSIFANSAFIEHLQSTTGSFMQSATGTALIKNLVASNVSVSDLQAGNITLSDNMKILSENGMMIMNGTALQIKGIDSEGNEYVGVQLGYNAQDNPSLILRNEDGAVVLTPQGITQDAIADQLIVNNMVADHTLAKTKMGWHVVEGDENGNIQITQVMDGNEQFGVIYAQFKQETESSLNEIREAGRIVVHIESNNGSIFRNGDANCTLTATVYEFGVDITDTLDPSVFVWNRTSVNTESDEEWNNLHKTGKTLVIQPEDVPYSCTFKVTVTIDDQEISSDDDNNGGG